MLRSRRYSRQGDKGAISGIIKAFYQRIRSVDALWVPCLWLFISSIRGSLHPGPEQIAYGGRHPYPIILSALLILATIILYSRRFNFSVFIKENKLVVLLYCWMGLSIIWSSFPWISFKRWVKTIGSLEMVLIILTEPDALAAFSSVIRRWFYLVVPLSITLIFFFPAFGLRYYPGEGTFSWVGLFINKNALAQPLMIFSLYFAWSLTRKEQNKNIFLDTLFLLLSLYVFFGAKSVTSFFAFFFGLGTFLIIAGGKKISPRFLGVIIVYLCVLAVVTYFFLTNLFWKHPIIPQVLESFGKDTTLTGRVDIWSNLWPIALKRPFLGYGFGGFWVEINPVLRSFWSTHGWHVLTAHNGYLFVLLDMGFVGVVIVLLLVFSTYCKISRSFAVHFELARLRMAILFSLLLHNIAEVSLCDLNDPLWVCFLFTAVSLPLVPRSEEAPSSAAICRGLPFFRYHPGLSQRAREFHGPGSFTP